MEPNKITITIELVESTAVDHSLSGKERIAEGIIEHLEKLPHDALLNVDTYDFINQHRHQEYKIIYY